MTIFEVQKIQGRVAVVAPNNGNSIIVDYLEECGLVQMQCPLTENGEAPNTCPELCPIERCEARDQRDRRMLTVVHF